MTIGGALSDLNNLLNADDIPCYYKPSIKAVMDTIAIEQESVIDKIRAEIEQEYNRLSATRADETLELGECLGLKMSLKIIDKYTADKE